MQTKVTVIIENRHPQKRRRVAVGRMGPGIATIILVEEDWLRETVETKGQEAVEVAI